MEIGIMGLPGAGKTTVFNVLARAHAQVAGYSAEPNRAAVKVPDDRLDRLAELFKPRKVTPAEVQYVDVAGVVRGVRDASASVLSHLRTVDVLLHVVRAFSGPLGEPSPARDLEEVNLELTFADLGQVEKRLERLEKEVRLGRGSPAERMLGERELALLGRIKAALEAGDPIRALGLEPDEELTIRGYGFLTAKPMLVVLNTYEPEEGVEEAVRDQARGPRTEVTSLAAKLEMELAELEPREAEQFMAELGIKESGLIRVIGLSYRLAGLQSFFTVGPDEVRAWTIKVGATALDAAGAIHSDLARGFIRAEVIRWDTLLELGSVAEGRKRGVLRSEGKDYAVQDGDVVTILFNV